MSELNKHDYFGGLLRYVFGTQNIMIEGYYEGIDYQGEQNGWQCVIVKKGKWYSEIEYNA